MRRRRSNLTAAGTESAVYAIGGVTLSGRIRASVAPSSAATETVIALDPDMGGWRSAAPMSRPRPTLRLIATSQHLSAIGRRAGNDELVSDVERDDPRARHVDDGRADGTGPSASRSGGDELRWRRSDRRCRRRTFTANRGLPTARRTTEIYRVDQTTLQTRFSCAPSRPPTAHLRRSARPRCSVDRGERRDALREI